MKLFTIKLNPQTRRDVFLAAARERRAPAVEKFPGRCFLQITAIHTFPDYLQGKTFADLWR
ncbi:MAG: hypothetical protein NZM11_06140 [Anaerolineales bacterium]|nr:hypothetical protein [Anaerolineales bacterium]